MAIFTGIGAAIAAVSGWIATLGPVGAFALRTAVGVGFSLAAQALSGKPKQAEQKFSINTGLAGGGALTRSFIMGKAPTGGSLVWANTWGRDSGSQNAWLTQVIALSDIPVKGLLEVWVDGVKVTYNPDLNNATVYGQSIPEFEKNGPNLYVKFYDGNQTAADPTLVSGDSTPDRPWDSTRVGRGVAYVIVRARSTKGVFSGIPAFTFVVDGIRLYDPSKDSTNGGSGPMRYDDYATWGGDGDDYPVVQIYNLMRGIRENGPTGRWLYGFQSMTGARLPGDNWSRQVGKCRAPILESGGPQPTYRSAGQIDVNAPLATALNELLTTCQGKISEQGGIYTIYVGEPDKPYFSIVDGDIVSTEEQEFTPFSGLADSINGISASYPEPLDGYAERTAPPLLRPDLEVLDGNRRLMADVQFTFVPYSEQVQRLMKSALLEALRYRRHTITLPPKFWRFAVPGETLRWTSVRNGYVNKLFVIDGVSDKANLDVTIDITEYDPNDYSWNSSTEFKPPVAGSVGPIIPAPRAIIAPYAEPYILRDENSGSRRPAIRLTWDNQPETLIGIVGVEWEVRVAGSPDVVSSGNTLNPERGNAIISAGIISATPYLVRMRYIPEEGREEQLWSGNIPVTSPEVLLGIGDLEAYLEVIANDAKYVWQKTAEQVDDIWKRVEHLGQATSLSEAAGTIDRREIKAQVGQASASIIEEREVRATETEALARRSLIIEALVSENEARIRTEELARADGDSALAIRISSIDSVLPGLASASSVEAIMTEVTAQGDALTAQGVRISTIEAVLPGLASASALNTLETRVSNAEGSLSAQAAAITATNATVGRFSANGFFRVSSEATPAGAQSRIGLYASASAGEGTTRTAAMYLEAVTGNLSRVVIQADQFAVLSGSNRRYPFVISGGVVYANEMRIGFAKIDDVQITGDLVVNGSLTAANLAFDAITGSTSRNRSASGNSPTTGVWVDMGSTWVFNNMNPNPVFTSFSISASGTRNPSGSTVYTIQVRLQNITDGVTVATRLLAISPGNSSANNSWQDVFVFEPKPGSGGNKTYAWQYNASFGVINYNVSASSTQLWWNR